MSDLSPAAREAAERLRVRARNYYATFNTEPGKAVLADLQAAFKNRTLFDTDSKLMAKNVGQFDVVRYIEQLIGAATRDE